MRRVIIKFIAEHEHFLPQSLLQLKDYIALHPTLLASTSSKFTTMIPKFDYPIARRDETIVENFHGTSVADPYRWLEDPYSDETKACVDAHNNITQPYLENSEKWQEIKEKLTKLWNYPKYTTPNRHGDYYFFYMNTGLQNQNVLFKQATITSEPIVFFDPNTLSDDGTIALSGTSFSDDGSLFAYSLRESGSDWNKIKIRNVKTDIDYDECLEKVKFSSMEWTKNNKGLFYCSYPTQDGKTDGSETDMNENQKLYYHRVGEPQEKDVLIAEFLDEPKWRIGAVVSDCGKYLILLVIKDCRDNLIFFTDLTAAGEITGKLNFTQVIHKFEYDYEYITNINSTVIFRTNKGAPNYQLISIDFNEPDEKNWKTLIAEDPTDVLDWAQCVNDDKIVLAYMHDVKSVLQVNYLETGKLIRKFPLDIGTIIGFGAKKKYSEIFYQFMSFLQPGIIYRYDFANPDIEPTVFREVNVKLEGFNSAEYLVEQIFYSSKDGTKIPMFVVQKRKTGKTETRPCLLYGYGGFNISLQPTFSITGLMFINTFDGVLAYPNIRGGGEYGEKWHNSGRLLNKQNVFDDFQWAAKYLVSNNYTEKRKLVIQGGSNGGLLVGTCINQTPDLFGAAIIQVGLLDMLRYNKFTIGQAWTSDYGSPDEKQHFYNLLSYSPVHNVKTPPNAQKQYPATLLLTADHDDRVSPLHSLKFVAALHNAVKYCEYQQNPLLLRVYSKSGHGAGKPTIKKIEESTDILAFVYNTLNLEIITD